MTTTSTVQVQISTGATATRITASGDSTAAQMILRMVQAHFAKSGTRTRLHQTAHCTALVFQPRKPRA